jgi:predicted  nucleic acid-binding Zn-ribbon protein
MKRRLILFCLSGLLSSCGPESEQSSGVKAFASNLSDTSGRLAQTFLYLSEGSTVVQRECTNALPRGPQDCPTVRGTQTIEAFRQAVQADLDLSRTRLQNAEVSLGRDRDRLGTRQGELTQRIATLEAQLRDLESQIANASTSGGDPDLVAALKFATEERNRLQAQLATTTDPLRASQLREFLTQFDREIENLKARIQRSQPNLGPLLAQRDNVQKSLSDARVAQQTAGTELSALETKLADTRAQQVIVSEELRILPQTLDRLRQALVFDARDLSTTVTTAEKQLVSRFHKLFQQNTPDCNVRPVDGLKELVITQIPVLTSAEAQVGGSWHFGELVKQLIGGNPNPQQVEAFLRNWMGHWERDVALANGDRAAPRAGFLEVFNAWKQASQARGVNGLDLRLAPFRLIGITNRMDLRNPLVVGDAGEARLAFALLQNPTDRPQDTTQNAQAFTVIFEYKVTVASDADLGRWASQWHELGALPCTTGNCQSYIGRLAQTTRMFTHRNTPGSIVRATLGQLRTNEIAFGNPWELREFQLQPAQAGVANRLVQVDVKKTPRISANNTRELSNFVARLSVQDLIDNNYDIPGNLQGAKAHVQSSAPEWRLSADDQRARIFNINTCNGCHSSDQAVIDGFYHISPFQGIGPQALSGHLRDQEIPRRSQVMASFLTPSSCTIGTPFDARLSNDLPRMLARPVH